MASLGLLVVDCLGQLIGSHRGRGRRSTGIEGTPCVHTLDEVTNLEDDHRHVASPLTHLLWCQLARSQEKQEHKIDLPTTGKSINCVVLLLVKMYVGFVNEGHIYHKIERLPGQFWSFVLMLRGQLGGY